MDKGKKIVQPTVFSGKVSGSAATHRTEQTAQSPLPRESHSQELTDESGPKSGACQAEEAQPDKATRLQYFFVMMMMFLLLVGLKNIIMPKMTVLYHSECCVLKSS